MKKTLSVVAVASLFVAGSAMASGYRIPEQSLDSTSKAGANIASADKADAAYYNPANMSWLDDAWQIEGTATYLHLSEIDYDDSRGSAFDSSSETENFLLPTFFVVSPDYNNFRLGLSLTAPYGLSKRWEDNMFSQAQANKFSLKLFDFNPTVSYKVNDMFSVAGGVRMIYGEATVMRSGSDLYTYTGLGDGSSLWMNGDTVEWGYNLAVDVRPNDNWNFALTYRSHVDIEFDDGDVLAILYSGYEISTTGDVTVPAPAVLALSTAYTCDKWTFDVTIDQTFWSEYETLAFDFVLLPDASYPKNWDDTIAVRLGVEYELSQALTLMGGIAYDENPVPDEYAGFELPDSDAWLFSFGVRYKQSEQLEYGVGVLYDYKEERDVVTSTGISGEFSNASAFLVSVGMSYKF
jgi:long-chain fatty acid transport protein